jgi:hypothetical protein
MALGYILADYGYDAKEVTTAVQSAYQNTAEHNTDTFTPTKKSAKSERLTSDRKPESSAPKPKTEISVMTMKSNPHTLINWKCF